MLHMLVLSFIKDDAFYCYGVTLREDYHSPYNKEGGVANIMFQASRRTGKRTDAMHLSALLRQVDDIEFETNRKKKDIVSDFVLFLSQFDFELLHTCPVSILDSANQELSVTQLKISRELAAYLKRAREEDQALTLWNQYFNEQLGHPLLEVEPAKVYRKD